MFSGNGMREAELREDFACGREQVHRRRCHARTRAAGWEAADSLEILPRAAEECVRGHAGIGRQRGFGDDIAALEALPQ